MGRFKHVDILRAKKKVHISIVPKDLISAAEVYGRFSYNAIRKRLISHKQNLRLKELGIYYVTYFRQHGILAKYESLPQGRIPESVFAGQYLKIEDFKVLKAQLLAIIDELEKDLVT